MVGHLANKLRWGGAATQQGSAAISQILRSELKFDGVVISDDLTMRAVLSGKSSLAQIARSSINGSVDLLLIGEPADPKIQNTGVHVNSAVMAGIESGDVATCTIKKAWQRVMSLKARLQSMQMQLNSQQTYVEGH